mmetsp:Transcript_14714/g.31540  ORF Transcript_14714/g.31540 Transcript_14714/m.31540 type:complete len:201 (+) Transcript_14714:594-1196(+)
MVNAWFLKALSDFERDGTLGLLKTGKIELIRDNWKRCITLYRQSVSEALAAGADLIELGNFDTLYRRNASPNEVGYRTQQLKAPSTLDFVGVPLQPQRARARATKADPMAPAKCKHGRNPKPKYTTEKRLSVRRTITVPFSVRKPPASKNRNGTVLNLSGVVHAPQKQSTVVRKAQVPVRSADFVALIKPASMGSVRALM